MSVPKAVLVLCVLAVAVALWPVSCRETSSDEIRAWLMEAEQAWRRDRLGGGAPCLRRAMEAQSWTDYMRALAIADSMSLDDAGFILGLDAKEEPVDVPRGVVEPICVRFGGAIESLRLGASRSNHQPPFGFSEALAFDVRTYQVDQLVALVARQACYLSAESALDAVELWSAILTFGFDLTSSPTLSHEMIGYRVIIDTLGHWLSSDVLLGLTEPAITQLESEILAIERELDARFPAGRFDVAVFAAQILAPPRGSHWLTISELDRIAAVGLLRQFYLRLDALDDVRWRVLRLQLQEISRQFTQSKRSIAALSVLPDVEGAEKTRRIALCEMRMAIMEIRWRLGKAGEALADPFGDDSLGVLVQGSGRVFRSVGPDSIDSEVCERHAQSRGR